MVAVARRFAGSVRSSAATVYWSSSFGSPSRAAACTIAAAAVRALSRPAPIGAGGGRGARAPPRQAGGAGGRGGGGGGGRPPPLQSSFSPFSSAPPAPLRD